MGEAVRKPGNFFRPNFQKRVSSSGVISWNGTTSRTVSTKWVATENCIVIFQVYYTTTTNTSYFTINSSNFKINGDGKAANIATPTQNVRTGVYYVKKGDIVDASITCSTSQSTATVYAEIYSI